MAAEATDTSTEQPVAASVANSIASIADPAPLGLASFAMTTFVLSVFNAGLITLKLEPVVLPLALFYGGLCQLLAGMWEFKRANTFGALAFTSYGAFWMAFAAYVKFVAGGLGSGAGTATGLFLLGWAILTAYLTVAALRLNVATLLVFIALTLTYLVLAIGNFANANAIVHVGGFLGIITAILAWYNSFALVANFTWKRTLLPIGPLS